MRRCLLAPQDVFIFVCSDGVPRPGLLPARDREPAVKHSQGVPPRWAGVVRLLSSILSAIYDSDSPDIGLRSHSLSLRPSGWRRWPCAATQRCASSRLRTSLLAFPPLPPLARSSVNLARRLFSSSSSSRSHPPPPPSLSPSPRSSPTTFTRYQNLSYVRRELTWRRSEIHQPRGDGGADSTRQPPDGALRTSPGPESAALADGGPWHRLPAMRWSSAWRASSSSTSACRWAGSTCVIPLLE